MGLPFTSAVALPVAMAEARQVAGELALELLANLEEYGRYDQRILADAIDLLAKLGVRSPVEYDDYLRGYAAARGFVKERKRGRS